MSSSSIPATVELNSPGYPLPYGALDLGGLVLARSDGGNRIRLVHLRVGIDRAPAVVVPIVGELLGA